jgi:hypothetical protein
VYVQHLVRVIGLGDLTAVRVRMELPVSLNV